ncbi:hypothetical protein HG536_0A03830 [Torulaspora globosa]|uniref:Alkyl transferase n=1 Tax=Torulaspora globosa TaxID=48254 RepID=A0A7G3ZAM9_9SACH|nr:uncharacterized protein HG536_0A03830 [Torulaspora globosa]QLL30565.1 hypothetical protein HG536_0A03830 [Torulaspora globosa]
MRLPNYVRFRLTGPSKELARSSRVNAYFKRIKDKVMPILIWLASFRVVAWLHESLQNILIGVIRVGPVPRHVSFIMDGNRRYAKKCDMPIKKGHEAGGVALLNLCYACKRIGIKCVSAYAFSIENFNRPKEEVETLTNMFSAKLDEFCDRANTLSDPLYGSRLRIVGDHSLVSADMREKIKRVERLTDNGDDFTLYICFPYTSRNDIYHTVCGSIEKSLADRAYASSLTVAGFTRSMYLEEFSNNCDLLIRTSGHMRLSDYMLWQSHENSEILFTSTLWPDFGFIRLYLALLRWSFFTNIQRYNEMGFSLRRKLYHSLPFVSGHAPVSVDSLPSPPIAISVTGESE